MVTPKHAPFAPFAHLLQFSKDSTRLWISTKESKGSKGSKVEVCVRAHARGIFGGNRKAARPS